MKKLAKILLILAIVVVVVAIALIVVLKNMSKNSGSDITEGYYKKFHSDAQLEMKFSQLGAYETDYVEFPSENQAIGKIRVWYPKELKSADHTYPMIVVVNASGTPAANYEPYFPRLASWGFIVAGNDDPQAGSGETASLTLDFLMNPPTDSILYGKINYDALGIVGYSQGGAGAICALTNYENGQNYKTIFTGSAAYQLLAKNMGWEYDPAKIKVPYFMAAGTGKSDDSGTDPTTGFGGVAPLSSQIENYNAISGDVMKARGRAVGAEHEQMLARSDGYMTAWMLWQLKGDKEAASVFVGDGAEILHNDSWQDIEKNF